MNEHTDNASFSGSEGATTLPTLHTIPFHGDEIVAIDRGGYHFVAMRRIVENMGLNWAGQHTKLLDQTAKFSCMDIHTTGADGKNYSMLCMPVEKLPLWLASINPNKITNAEIRAKVECYQAESAIALHDYWTKGSARRSGIEIDDLSAEVRKVVGGIVKSVVHSEISTALASLSPSAAAIQLAVQAELARQHFVVRRGKTAGQIYHDNRFPPLKNIASWFGNKLAKAGCRIADNGRAEMGMNKARLFDPDKAQAWLDELGGRHIVQQKVTERLGQKAFNLVPLKPATPPKAGPNGGLLASLVAVVVSALALTGNIGDGSEAKVAQLLEGQGVIILNGEPVRFDATRYKPKDDESVLRLHSDGRVTVGPVMPNTKASWQGVRTAFEEWRLARQGDPAHAIRGRVSDTVQVLGAVIGGDRVDARCDDVNARLQRGERVPCRVG